MAYAFKNCIQELHFKIHISKHICLIINEIHIQRQQVHSKQEEEKSHVTLARDQNIRSYAFVISEQNIVISNGNRNNKLIQKREIKQIDVLVCINKHLKPIQNCHQLRDAKHVFELLMLELYLQIFTYFSDFIIFNPVDVGINI